MLHSFPIHLAQCKELYEKREALKPPKERRPLPPDPMFVGKLSGSGSVSRRQIDDDDAEADALKPAALAALTARRNASLSALQCDGGGAAADDAEDIEDVPRRPRDGLLL